MNELVGMLNFSARQEVCLCCRHFGNYRIGCCFNETLLTHSNFYFHIDLHFSIVSNVLGVFSNAIVSQALGIYNRLSWPHGAFSTALTFSSKHAGNGKFFFISGWLNRISDF